MNRTCTQCGTEFSLSEQEIEIYKKNKLELPSLCRDCRRRRRMEPDAIVEKRFFGLVRRRDKKNPRRRPGALAMIFRGKAMLPAMLLLIAFALFSGARMARDNEMRRESAEKEDLIFESFDKLEEAFETYGRQMGYTTAEEYLAGANDVVYNKDSIHYTDDANGEQTYFLEKTGELVVVGKDGKLQRYYKK